MLHACSVAVVIRLGTQEAEGLSKSDVAKRMKVTDVLYSLRHHFESINV